MAAGGKAKTASVAAMTQDLKTPMPPAASGPTASGKRFLAHLMDHAFREGWRTPDDFVKHFPADVIMSALKSAPDLRVAILAAATGIYEEILRRKTPALAAEDLRLALDEGTTSTLQLLTVFSAEDRVRYLDPHRIWDFLAADHFWQTDADASEEARQGAADRMVFTLSQALQERLLTLRDVLDGLTYDAVADSLSPHELRVVVRHALAKGRDGIGLNEKVLLEVLPLDKLVRTVSLEHIWHEVIIRRLAIPCGLTDLSREERRNSQAERRSQHESRRWSSRPPGPPGLPIDLVRGIPGQPLHMGYSAGDAVTALPPSASREGGGFGNASPFGPGVGSGANEYAAGDYVTNDYVTNDYVTNDYVTDDYVTNDDLLTAAPPPVTGIRSSLLPPPPVLHQALMTLPQPALVASRPLGAFQQPETQDGEGSDRQRQRVTEHLRAIGRLPPRHANMPAPVLRSIDAMYALLPSATDDIQRKSVIRQAFASENYLRAALLGLIELMDSSVDTSDPVIQEAKIEALIKILLFEEQRRKETGRFPSGPFSAPRSPASSLPPSSASSNAPPSSVPVVGGPGGAFYYPPRSPPPAYAANGAVVPPHVATKRPPPPVLSAVPGYTGSAAPPLPNLPAEPAPSSHRRSLPPPLPPSYPRG